MHLYFLMSNNFRSLNDFDFVAPRRGRVEGVEMGGGRGGYRGGGRGGGGGLMKH